MLFFLPKSTFSHIYFVLYFLTEFHLGDAISKNPGYLKLRKIRAAQNIARTVSIYFFFSYLTTAVC